MHSGFRPQLAHPQLSPITTGRLRRLQRCHELVSGCLVLVGTPLSSWWTATSIWSKATFDTSIRVPPSQIGMLWISILRVQWLNNRCRPLPLPVRSLLGREASGALIYNGYIQLQPPWYLQVPPQRDMTMLPTHNQVILVRNKFWCAFKFFWHLQVVTRVCQRCLLIFQELWKWQYRCIVRLAIQAQWHIFSCWHPYLQTKASRFDVDGQGSRRIRATAMIRKNRFTTIYKKIKRWIKRAL